jgi:hypothetical protein
MGKHLGKLWGNIRQTKPNKTILNHFGLPAQNPSKHLFLSAPPPFFGGALSSPK